MTSFRENICNPVLWGEHQQSIIQDQELRLNLWNCWLWYILPFQILAQLINSFLAFISDTIAQAAALLWAGTLLEACAFGSFEEDKTAIFVSNSFGRHNVWRIRRERCLLNWVICFGQNCLKGNLFLELYLQLDSTEVFWSSLWQDQGLFYQQMRTTLFCNLKFVFSCSVSVSWMTFMRSCRTWIGRATAKTNAHRLQTWKGHGDGLCLF